MRHDRLDGRSTRFRAVLALSLPAALVVLVWLRFSWLWAHPVAYGVDGYYYALQVATLSSQGRPYFHTPFLIVPALGAIVGVCSGLSAVSAMKILAVALCSMAGPLVYGLSSRFSSARDSFWAGLVVAISSLANYFVVEFVSQLGAVVAVLAASCAYTANRRAIRTLTLPLVLVALCAHKSTAVVLSAVIVASCALRAIDRYALTRRIPLVAGAIAVGATLFAIITHMGNWSEPPISQGRPHHQAASSEVILAVVAACTMVASRFLIRKDGSGDVHPGAERGRLSWALACLVPVLFANPGVNYASALNGVPERIALWSWPVSGLLLAAALASTRRSESRTAAAVRVLLLVVATIVLLPRWPPASQSEYLRDRVALARAMEVTPLCGGQSSSIVIAEHGTQFLVTYASGTRAVSRRPASLNGEGDYWWLIRPPETFASQIAERARGCRLGPMYLISHDRFWPWLLSTSDVVRAAIAARNTHVREALDVERHIQLK